MCTVKLLDLHNATSYLSSVSTDRRSEAPGRSLAPGERAPVLKNESSVMRYFPLFIDMQNTSVLVVGGTEHATAKLRSLLKSDANIVVIAERFSDQILAWAKAGRLALVERDFQRSDVAGYRLIVVATDDPTRNRELATAARVQGALVNVADDLASSDVLFPAIVDRSPLVVAIGSEGSAPALVRAVKAKVEALLPFDLGTLARISAPARDAGRKLGAGRFRDVLARFFDGEGERSLSGHGASAARDLLETMIHEASNDHAPRGRVDLVGAGPGDPELLTLKARRVLDQADVVLHDRLVDARILDLARREATIVEVGKTARGQSWSQSEVNALMVRHAQQGARVVRLKSGDPLLFGRADEEIKALEGAEIPYAIVPGVSAAFAAAAGGGFSLTRRGRNRAVTFITAHDVEGFADHDWRHLARKGSAVAIYMGVQAARFVQGRLLIHGADASTPITIVERASRPDEKRVIGTLGRLAALIEDAAIEGPAIIFIGLAPNDASAASRPELYTSRQPAHAGGGAW